MAIGSWPSRPRPGLGLDFGLIHFKSNSLILDIAHYKIVAVYKNVGETGAPWDGKIQTPQTYI